MIVSASAPPDTRSTSVAAGAAVVADGVSKRYPNGIEALRDMTLRVERGEMVGLLGASGSGKTTLLRLLNGTLRPTAGALAVLGADVAALGGARLGALRRQVAVVAQQHSLVGRGSVLHNVLLGRAGQRPLLGALRASLLATAQERAAVRAALAELGLGGTLSQRVDTLSGGQQQRVAVARALYQGGALLLADEPVASVDEETAHVILQALGRLAGEGRAVLVSLHQRTLALQYCTRLVALAQGSVVYDGPPDRAAWQSTKDEGRKTEDSSFVLRPSSAQRSSALCSPIRRGR